MKIIHRLCAFVLAIAMILSNVMISVATEEWTEQSAESITKTLYRYRERVETITRTPLEEPWTLISKDSSLQLLREYNELDPSELADMEDEYSADYYYTTKISDGTICKFSTRPHGGAVYYYDESFLDGPKGMYDETQYTYYEHPTTGLKLYLRDVCNTYKLSVYTQYEYHYWKWSEWSEWSETSYEASETVEIETKESDVLYRYREKQFATSKTQLDNPWVLYNTTTEYNHLSFSKIYISEYEATKWERENTNKYCIHKKELVGKYIAPSGASWVYATPSEWSELKSNSDIWDDHQREPTWYYRFTYCKSKEAYTLYHYYQWNEWSEWGYSPVEENDNMEVETTIACYVVVSYDANGGMGVPASSTKWYNETITLSTVIPTRESHRFLGWSTDPQGAVEYDPGAEYSANADVTLYAIWKNVTPYTVSYDANGGTGAPTQQHKIYDETITISLDIPTREGYSFVGWSTTADGEEEYRPGDKFSENADVTLYAIWEKDNNSYKVVFKDWNGEILSSTTYSWGDTVIIPVEPTKPSDNIYTYAFSGWDNDVSFVCKGNATYTATYTSTYREYTVFFVDWNNRILSYELYHWGDWIRSPDRPRRVSDDVYNYTFDGWDKPVGQCTGNITYRATYKQTYIDYTVVFKNWDGTVLSTKTYHWGDTVIEPATPTKPADNTSTYAFAGWNKEVVNCAGDATYTATYTSTNLSYTIVFKNWDGSVLSSKTYHYGDKVTVPANPTRVADNTYTYTFKGWDKTVENCAGNATYIAQYNATYRNYTIVFKNWNGAVLSSKTYHYGDKVIVPANPTRTADNTYTYTFKGWDKTVVNCSGAATYTAQYTATYKNYTITFKNWDGSVLSTKTYHYGDKVTAPSNPVRAADNTYTYSFKGWDKTVVNCVSNATYTAQYTATYKNYTITFKNWDGTVLSSKTYHWGDTVVEPTTPTKPADNTATYAFAGWDKEVVSCAGDVTYTATFASTNLSYTVVFKNWDGTVLSTKTYHYGDVVSAPANPTRTADNTYTYTFKGWDKTIVNCAGATTYTAQFTANYKNYAVTFRNWDGTVLSKKTYHYGDVVSAPENPTRTADNTYTYTFKGWDKTIVNCAGATTYTAQYTATYKNYTVTFKNWDGTVLSTKTYHYGDKVAVPTNPTKVTDKTYTYIFKGWDKTVANCTGNATYTATYTSAYINYTVTFKDWNGEVLSTKTYHYGDTVTVPANPVRPEDDSYAYTFTGWDKTVMPSCNGNAVYTAVYSKATRVPSAITSPNYAIRNGTISKIAIGTKVSDLLSKINERQYVKVYNGDQEVSGSSLIGTGMVVKIMDGDTAKASYTIIVTGDTNGDGKISITDMLAVKAHILKKSTLSGAAAQAADANGDSGISITDFIQIKANILGKGTITPH